MHPLLFAVLISVSARPSDDSVDYLRDIKPMLAKNCVACHGAARPRGGLRLDTAKNAIKGGKGGASVVPGRVEESLLIEAILGDGAIERMPLKRPALSVVEVAKVRRWIESGAKFPPDEVPTTLDQTHWAFQKPIRPVPPTLSIASIAANPIDAFIRDRLKREKVEASAEADRVTLIRRLSLDLIGLPPTPEEVAAFVADERPDAYERQVDRLLASPRYGERWARPWLDLARYADSNGYSIDAPRSIWKYRDWVINALNRNLSFDEFLTDQLAGDLLPSASVDQKTATGFHRNTPINQEGGIDVEQFRVESVVDRVSTTGSVFLGLTVGCAQCHDHKYDPISQREFYDLFAFFNSVDEPDLAFGNPEQAARLAKINKEVDAFHVALSKDHPEIVEKERVWETTLSADFKVAQVPDIKDAFDKMDEMRSTDQRRGLIELYLSKAKEYRKESAQLRKLRADEPKVITTMIVRERAKPRATFIMLGGDFTRKGEPVAPGVPAVLPRIRGRSSGKLDRLDLARWLTQGDQPLTSRVTVNRVWQAYFGRGLVETENDFGTQGNPPSHPELLDWLAAEFQNQGWSQKRLHRTIVTSLTYRQSSRSRPDLDRVDPDNRLLARQSRLRLDAELIRDASLSASGLLTDTLGGPSVFPPQPDGVMTLGQMKRPWFASTGPDRYRRGLYTYFWRATPHPGLTLFDAPNAIQACTRRPRSNTPVQALTLLNDEAAYECARTLGARVMGEVRGSDSARIDRAFQLALGRSPSSSEERTLAALLDQERGTPRPVPQRDESRAWTAVARVLLNIDEFMTRE